MKDMGKLRRALVVNGLLVLAALLLPALGLNSYQLFISTLVVVYVIVGLGVDLMFGYAGAITIGTVGFYGLGAYTGVLMARAGYDVIAIVPVVLAIGIASGLVLGIISMRLRGFGFAIVTYGFAVVIQTAIIAMPKVTGGLIGLSVPVPKLFGTPLSEPLHVYLFCVGCAVVFIACNALAGLSFLGRSLMAIQASETMAKSVGIRPAPYLIAALAYSGAAAALGGMLFVFASRYIASPAFNPLQSVTFFALVVIGGVRSNLGVVLGALIVVWLPSQLQSTAELSSVIFGVALMLALILSPRGLVGFASNVARYLRRRLPVEAPVAGRPEEVAAHATGR